MPKNSLPKDKNLESFWSAYGRFIYAFSRVEQSLLDFLWQLAGVRSDLARAVFQDARFGNMCETINRIYKSRGVQENAFYRRAVDQMGYIAKLRNDMVHLPSALVKFDGDDSITALISNKLKAMPGKEREIHVKEQTLLDMSHDMAVASICFQVAQIESFDLPPDARLIDHQEAAQTPWRYKPPQQPVQKERRRKRPQARTLPPTSSTQ